MTTSYYNGGPVTVVQVLLPSDAPVATGYDTYDDDYALTSYFVDLVYTAPTACSSQWTTTTAVPLYVPRNIQDVLKPSSTSMSYSVNNSRPFQPTTITHLKAWIGPTQIPESHLSELRRFYEMYDPSCSYSTAYNGDFDDCSDDSGSTDDSSSNYDSGQNYSSESNYDSGSGYYNGNGYNDYDDYNWLYDDY